MKGTGRYQTAASPYCPRCEFRSDPLGIDITRPGLSWKVKSSKRGEKQTAYRILAASSSEMLEKDTGDLWDSGKVPSDQTIQVEYNGKMLCSHMKCFWKVRIWDSEGTASAWSRTAFWTMGKLDEKDWRGHWIGARPGAPKKMRPPFRDGYTEKASTAVDQTNAAAVCLRRSVTLGRRPVRATAYICGLGYYELYINGQRIGGHKLDPAFTDYMKRVFYVTYDVSGMFAAGTNVIGAMLGNGFYNTQTADCFQIDKAGWRTPPRMLLDIVLEYDDGSSEAIVTDESWKWSEGSIIFNDIRSGETIDNRRSLSGWTSPGYDDSRWENAIIVDAPLGRLQSQSVPPIKAAGEIRPENITEPKPGIYVADFGGNLAGWVRLKVTGKEGQLVTLDFNEVLREDGLVDMKANTSHTYGRYQHQECILSGMKDEVFEPHFTYHAFRYVEIHGLDNIPLPEDITAVRMHADLAHAGFFKCSEPRLVQLHDAAKRTLEDCSWSGPTAEPLREKVIWLGDSNFEIDSYFYLLDCSLLYRKYVEDIIIGQEPCGHISPVIPNCGWGEVDEEGGRHYCSDPWWGLSLAVSVKRLSEDYGDTRITRAAYEACRNYLDYMTGTAKGGCLDWSLGDWLERSEDGNPVATMTPVTLTSTAGYFYQAILVAGMADKLGMTEDARKYSQLADSIKETFNMRFYNAAEGHYGRDSQTAQSLPLSLGLVPPDKRQQVFDHLYEAVVKAGNKLTAGFIGTLPTIYMLSEYGQGDLAYELIREGWFWMLKNGNKCTLNESPYLRSRTDSSHHQFGAITAGWLYRYLAGIRPGDGGKGYAETVIKPMEVHGITWVRADHDSVHGMIRSGWRRNGRVFELDVSIPANTCALVHIPAASIADVTESGSPAVGAQGVEFIRIEQGAAVFKTGSGDYFFRNENVDPLRST